MNTLEKQNSPPRSAILRNFQNQEYQFTIPKSQKRLAEKSAVGEEHAIAKRFTFYANAIKKTCLEVFLNERQL